jgi:hypothetical protein
VEIEKASSNVLEAQVTLSLQGGERDTRSARYRSSIYAGSRLCQPAWTPSE